MSVYSSIEEFAASLSSEGPIISLDYGVKKIGIAISSPNRSMSLPLSIIENLSKKKTIEKIKKILKDKNVIGIVLGLPIRTDGSESANSSKIVVLAHELANAYSLPIFLQEERRTTRAADSLLQIAGFNRKQRNNLDDSIAASLILDAVLMRL